MTTAIVLPDYSFPIHVPLYDIPNAANNRIYGIYGSTLAESLVNHSGRGAGSAVGAVNVEPMGIRQYGTTDCIRYSDLGVLSSAGFTMMVAFKAPLTELTSGLINLWSQADKNADSLRRRLFLDGSTAGTVPLRANSYPTTTEGDTGRQLVAGNPYVLSISRHGSGVASLMRVHNQDGSVHATFTLPNQTALIDYSTGTVLEVGNGSSANSGGSLIQGVGLWSGVMAPTAIVQAAASLALASGVFD